MPYERLFPVVIVYLVGSIPSLLQKRAIIYLIEAYLLNYFQQKLIIMGTCRWAYHLTGSNIYIVLDEQDVKAKKVKVSC